MKRFALVLTAVAIVLSMLCVTAGADALPTPWSDETMKVFVMEDFDGLSGDVEFVWAHNSDFDAHYENDQLVLDQIFYLGGGGWGYSKVKLVSNAPASATGVLGYGYYIENNTDADLAVAGYWIGNDNFVGAANGTYYTVVDGEVTQHTTDEYGAVIFASGFKGYFLIPFASHNAGGWTGTPVTGVVFNAETDYVSISMSSFDAEQGNVVLDDFMLYGTAEMEGEVIGGDDNTGDDNTGDDNTGDDNTGDDNTGDDNTGDDNESEDTADVSVITYAAAAITGLGALVVAKKR